MTRRPLQRPEYAADRQRAGGFRRSARRGLPRRRRPPKSNSSGARKPQREGAAAGESDHRRRHSPRGHEHHRPQGPPGRDGPLRRLGLHAHRGMGRQHRHPHPGRARLRHPAAVRTGRRPRPAPAILRPEQDGLFDAEYADIMGIPFDFTAQPVVAKPKPPKPTTQVRL